MTIPDKAYQIVEWTLIVLLAIFAAEASDAIVENSLSVAPRPLPITAPLAPKANGPAQAIPPGLPKLLATTEPPSSQRGTSASSADGYGPQSNPSSDGEGATQSASIKLRGTMAEASGAGLAMIDINGKTNVFSVGDTVTGGLTLTSVSAYSATLKGEGQSQVLEMDVAVSITTESDESGEEVTSDETPSPDSSQTPDASGAILSQRELRNILDHPEQFAGNGFRMKPVLREGEIVGMGIRLKDPNHPLARLGIQDGDIVRTLNGQELNGPEALTSIYRVIRNSPNLRFEVERNGQTETINVALSE